MRDQGGESGSPLWADGDMTLRVVGEGREADRIVRVDRPFAVVGQAADSDIPIGDQAVNGRHVYLHLDARGVYAVDLATRTGTRLEGSVQMAGWLAPGDWLEVAGRRVELLRIRIGGSLVEPPRCDDDPLAETGAGPPLVAVTLEPKRGPEGPWTVGSELIFLGWSSACGIQVKDPAVAKVHCALVRTASAAYLVDLCGRHTRIEGRPVRGASIVDDGATLTVGATPFTVRVGPAVRRSPATTELAPLVARVIHPEIIQGSDDPQSSDLMPADSQNALFAWMVETIQKTQGAVLRQQGEMQTSLAQMLRQVQQDNAALLNAHLERLERIDRELASLRLELAQRSGDPTPTPPPPPQATPLRIARKSPAPAGSQASTTWLLERVSQLEDENRSAWKDLLGRVSPPPRRAP